MKKVVLVLFLALSSISFASSGDVNVKNEINKIQAKKKSSKPEPVHVLKITVYTTCGHVSVGYSYEPVTVKQLQAYAREQEEFWCSKL